MYHKRTVRHKAFHHKQQRLHKEAMPAQSQTASMAATVLFSEKHDMLADMVFAPMPPATVARALPRMINVKAAIRELSSQVDNMLTLARQRKQPPCQPAFDSRKVPAAACLKKAASYSGSCDVINAARLDSADKTAVRRCASEPRPAISSKSVSFAEEVYAYRTYSPSKYRRRGFGKRRMTDEEIDELVEEMRQFKLNWDLHPEARSSVQWLAKTVPGAPRKTDLAMQALRRRRARGEA